MATTKNIKNLVFGIFSGYSFRKTVVADPAGDLHVIQMKDLTNRYTAIKAESLTTVLSDDIRADSFLKKGDILFIAKGAHNYAIVFDLDLPKAIASSAFFVIRPDPVKILPDYLAWYINQYTVQRFLSSNASGAYIPSVAKTTLERITVIFPPVEMQHKIVNIDKLVKREELLMQRIIKNKRLVVTRALMKIIETK